MTAELDAGVTYPDVPETETIRALRRRLELAPDDRFVRDVLADAYQDAGVDDRDRAVFLADKDAREARAFRFFLTQEGGPKYGAGAAGNARRLARAERWLADHGGVVTWEVDHDALRDWMNGENGPEGEDDGRDIWQVELWQVLVTVPCPDCHDEGMGEHSPGLHVRYARCPDHRPEWESVGGVDFGPGGNPENDPYARLLVAELAYELMRPDRQKPDKGGP